MTDVERARDWYIEHMGGNVGETPETVAWGKWPADHPLPIQLHFQLSADARPSAGSTIDHIGFSFADVAAHVEKLRAAGVKIVSPVTDVPGLWKQAVAEDPWGTKLMLVEDPDALGIHHVELRVPNPDATLQWYVHAFGGDRTKYKGRIEAVRYRDLGVFYLFAVPDAEARRGTGTLHRPPQFRTDRSRQGRERAHGRGREVHLQPESQNQSRVPLRPGGKWQRHPQALLRPAGPTLPPRRLPGRARTTSTWSWCSIWKREDIESRACSIASSSSRLNNRLIVLLLAGGLGVWGWWAVGATPIDAIPDLSDNQVIVFTEWAGHSAREVEDQVSYPLTVNLQGLPGVRVVRSQSAFGFSMIYVIFEDDVEQYFARTRVLERLNLVSGMLPEGTTPTLGPDATGVGHVFWYTIESDRHSLRDLRSIQDWFVRYQLNAVPGVAEVASIGGHVQQYQIDIDPNRLRAYNLSLGDVVEAVRQSNQNVGGNVLESNGTWSIVRGVGLVESVDDIAQIVVGASGGVPVYVNQVGEVRIGDAFRVSSLVKGTDEAVGGVIVARTGANAQQVIDGVKARIATDQPGPARRRARSSRSTTVRR